jgi:ubiquinone/menaquinone biosynthesis C-methylase UbiE
MSYDYNEIAKIYDDVRESDFKTVEFIIKTANIKDSSRILEIGCGTGNNLKLIKKLTKAELWGIDSSKGMLEKAKEKCEDAIFIEDDAVQLSKIEDGLFDVVYMVDVIHHIKDIDTMFQNIKRILKPNCPVIIFSDSHEHIKNRLTTKYFPETLEPELKRYQDTPEIVQSLSMTGFKKVESGIIESGIDDAFGPKLIELAEKKGYSMFGLISEEAIENGINRIKTDLLKQPIIYKQRAPYIIGIK